MFMHHPEVAKEFASKMTHNEEMALPEHVKKMADGGMACMHCGGAVGEDGISEGGVMEDPSEENEMGETEQDHHADEDDTAARMNFITAVRRGR